MAEHAGIQAIMAEINQKQFILIDRKRELTNAQKRRDDAQAAVDSTELALTQLRAAKRHLEETLGTTED